MVNTKLRDKDYYYPEKSGERVHKEWWPTLRAKLRGHYQYYGISGNSHAIERYHYVTKQLVFKWLNRRSQKSSFTWKGFEAYLEHYPLPEPRIVHHLYTLSFAS